MDFKSDYGKEFEEIEHFKFQTDTERKGWDKAKLKKVLEKMIKEQNKEHKNKTICRDDYKSDSEFNKALMTIYSKKVEQYINAGNEYQLLSLEMLIDCPGLIKLIHLLVFRKELLVSQKIKLVKDAQVSLYETILLEMHLYETIMYEMHTDNTGMNKEQDEFDLGIGAEVAAIILNTIILIKMIKYGMSKANISYFNDDGSENKIIKGYKMISTIPESALIKVFSREHISYDDLEYYANQVFPMEHVLESKIKEFLYYSIQYFENSRDYEKYVIGSEYHKLVPNPVFIHALNNMLRVLPPKVFARRKVLVPKSGVVLDIQGDSHIEGILIKEVSKGAVNHIVIIIRNKYGEERVGTVILQRNEITSVIYMEDIDTEITSLAYVYDFFGMSEELQTLKDALGYDSDMELKYEVISPYYWKYRKLYSPSEDKKDAKEVTVRRMHEVEIAAFIRKSSGGASEEAKKLAKRLCVELEDGYTIVRPHTRTYNKIEH